ncbi:MAG: methionyl-tRNA formyltransferase [Phycisphaerales bacterium]|jgi:methionyl-tRNA formyltransferase|nr:methionyl-tRNA formyltransferase [Phycisphaerales bacterium]
MRILFLGSGEFGLPTLKRLHAEHDVQAVITAPPRVAGRNRKPRQTPIGAWALEEGLTVLEPENINDPEIIAHVNELNPEAMVVIAYGQKLHPALLGDRFTINLHGSLLPRWRGAAPINAAIIHGDTVSGVSVISLAERMDAGVVYGASSIDILETETAGELHERLALLGPEIVLNVLTGNRQGEAQDETQVTYAPKISRKDATLDLHEPAVRLVRKIRGYTPWPSCHLRIAGIDCKILRAIPNTTSGNIGEILEDGAIAVGDGSIQILELQPAGGRAMTWKDFCNGRKIRQGDQCENVR